jgi:beta-D-xylosidase 4
LEGIVLLKNDGTLPLSPFITKIAFIGPWANATTKMQGNYEGVAPFLISPFEAAKRAGLDVTYSVGTSINTSDRSGFDAAICAGRESEVIVFAGGIDNSIEQETRDRNEITWPGNQLLLLSHLSRLDKPVIVLQMGGGQVDSSSLKTDYSVQQSICLILNLYD